MLSDARKLKDMRNPHTQQRILAGLWDKVDTGDRFYVVKNGKTYMFTWKKLEDSKKKWFLWADKLRNREQAFREANRSG